MEVTILRACGHREKKKFDNNLTDEKRQEKIAMFERGQCVECWKAMKAEEAKKFTEELKLPTLKGTDKQTQWASAIRVELMQSILSTIDSFKSEKNTEGEAAAINAIKKLRDESESRFWIDHKDLKAADLIKLVNK